jgi:hypothetical protein
MRRYGGIGKGRLFSAVNRRAHLFANRRPRAPLALASFGITGAVHSCRAGFFAFIGLAILGAITIEFLSRKLVSFREPGLSTASVERESSQLAGQTALMIQRPYLVLREN